MGGALCGFIQGDGWGPRCVGSCPGSSGSLRSVRSVLGRPPPIMDWPSPIMESCLFAILDRVLGPYFVPCLFVNPITG